MWCDTVCEYYIIHDGSSFSLLTTDEPKHWLHMDRESVLHATNCLDWYSATYSCSEECVSSLMTENGFLFRGEQRQSLCCRATPWLKSNPLTLVELGVQLIMEPIFFLIGSHKSLAQLKVVNRKKYGESWWSHRRLLSQALQPFNFCCANG